MGKSTFSGVKYSSWSVVCNFLDETLKIRPNTHAFIDFLHFRLCWLESARKDQHHHGWAGHWICGGVERSPDPGRRGLWRVSCIIHLYFVTFIKELPYQFSLFFSPPFKLMYFCLQSKIIDQQGYWGGSCHEDGGLGQTSRCSRCCPQGDLSAPHAETCKHHKILW